MISVALKQLVMRALSDEERRIAMSPRPPVPSPALDRKLARASKRVEQAQFLAARDCNYARAARAFEYARRMRHVQGDPFRRAAMQAVMHGAVAYAVRTSEGWS